MKSKHLLTLCCLLFVLHWYLPVHAQLPVSKGFEQAVKSNTRTNQGIPGPGYWQNQADYQLFLALDPKTNVLSGREDIQYFNNSPDTLDRLLLMLLPDLYREDNIRDFEASREDLHSGIEIKKLLVNGQNFDASRKGGALVYETTYAWIPLKQAILPGKTAELDIEWSYPVNRGTHMRTGQVDPSSYFIAYCFPRIGVYDDIQGWNPYDYTGDGEFYNDFGDFTVKIELPSEYTVWASGELQNPEEVLASKVLEQYQEARNSGITTAIISEEDLGKSTTNQENGLNTWHYTVKNVSDFAFGCSDHYLWDGVSLPVGQEGAQVFVSTAYPANSPDFAHVIHIAAESLEYMVERIPGMPFPYPSLTVFNGLDEMEYPMMVNNHSFYKLEETFGLTAHEIYHSYFPFMTGNNERKYAWMDEGLTSFFEYNLVYDLVDETLAAPYRLEQYQQIAGSEKDLPLITSSELLRPAVYYELSYAKAAVFYNELRHILGTEHFNQMIASFAFAWEGKHPTGYDLLHFFLREGGADLYDLIYPWFYTYGYVDLSIAEVKESVKFTELIVENNGSLPAGFIVEVHRKDGKNERIRIPASIWFDDTKTTTIRLKEHGPFNLIELKQDMPVDVMPANNRTFAEPE